MMNSFNHQATNQIRKFSSNKFVRVKTMKTMKINRVMLNRIIFKDRQIH
jgi:hypothetical protein